MRVDLNIADELRQIVRDELLAALRPDDQWLDSAGTAAHLKCSKQRIYNLTSGGKIPVHREGSRLLFYRSELDAWITSGEAAA